MSANVEHLQLLYASFDQGDIPAVLAGLAEDIQWQLFGDPATNSLSGLYSGLAGVGEFFSKLSAQLEDMKLEREQWIDGGDKVVVSGEFSAVGRANGLPLKSRFVHIWAFNAAGRPQRFEDFVDTEAFSRVMNAQAASASA